MDLPPIRVRMSRYDAGYLQGSSITPGVTCKASRSAPDDSNIKLLRAGRYKPGVERLVMELKNEVRPQVFVLPSVGEYGHRLVLDVYPLDPPDPLLSLLDKKEPEPVAVENRLDVIAEAKPEPKRPGKPVVDRLVMITLDPGHGLDVVVRRFSCC